MKRTTYPLLLAMTALLVLALSACVRPAPGTENLPEATAPLPGALLPTLPLPTATIPIAASPTPLPLPAEASPTPLPPAVEPTAAPAVQPTAPATGERIHIVVAGENLFRIGLQYGFTAQELATYNNIPNVDRINVGQEIRIPAQ